LYPHEYDQQGDLKVLKKAFIARKEGIKCAEKTQQEKDPSGLHVLFKILRELDCDRIQSFTFGFGFCSLFRVEYGDNYQGPQDGIQYRLQ
jgi:hypothetical protein